MKTMIPRARGAERHVTMPCISHSISDAAANFQFHKNGGARKFNRVLIDVASLLLPLLPANDDDDVVAAKLTDLAMVAVFASRWSGRAYVWKSLIWF